MAGFYLWRFLIFGGREGGGLFFFFWGGGGGGGESIPVSDRCKMERLR